MATTALAARGREVPAKYIIRVLSIGEGHVSATPSKTQNGVAPRRGRDRPKFTLAVDACPTRRDQSLKVVLAAYAWRETKWLLHQANIS